MKNVGIQTLGNYNSVDQFSKFKNVGVGVDCGVAWRTAAEGNTVKQEELSMFRSFINYRKQQEQDLTSYKSCLNQDEQDWKKSENLKEVSFIHRYQSKIIPYSPIKAQPQSQLLNSKDISIQISIMDQLPQLSKKQCSESKQKRKYVEDQTEQSQSVVKVASVGFHEKVDHDDQFLMIKQTAESQIMRNIKTDLIKQLARVNNIIPKRSKKPSSLLANNSVSFSQISKFRDSFFC